MEKAIGLSGKLKEQQKRKRGRHKRRKGEKKGKKWEIEFCLDVPKEFLKENLEADGK